MVNYEGMWKELKLNIEDLGDDELLNQMNEIEKTYNSDCIKVTCKNDNNMIKKGVDYLLDNTTIHTIENDWYADIYTLDGNYIGSFEMVNFTRNSLRRN